MRTKRCACSMRCVRWDVTEVVAELRCSLCCAFCRARKVTKLGRECELKSCLCITKMQKRALQCYFNVIFSFSQPQMPYNKPIHSDLLDFFAYICAIFRVRTFSTYLAVNEPPTPEGRAWGDREAKAEEERGGKWGRRLKQNKKH